MNKQELNRFIDKISPTGPGGIEKIKKVLKLVLDKEGEGKEGEESITETSYSDLKTLRDNGQLIPGHLYRITDYVTTTVQEGTISAMHRFDIIVQAISESILSEDARAVQHKFEMPKEAVGGLWDEPLHFSGTALIDGISYFVYETDESFKYPNKYLLRTDRTPKLEYVNDFYQFTSDLMWNPTEGYHNSGDIIRFEQDIHKLLYFNSSNLAAWKLKYCLDNDTDRFAWARTEAQLSPVSHQKILRLLDDNHNTFIYVRCSEKDSENGCAWAYDGIGDDRSIQEYITNGNENPDTNDLIYTPSKNVSVGDILNMSDINVTVVEVSQPEGKGVIYQMIDEYNNNCPYDFKNILFLRDLNWHQTYEEWCNIVLGMCPDEDVYYYTFTWVPENGYTSLEDASVTAQQIVSEDGVAYGVKNNCIKEFQAEGYPYGIGLNNIIIVGSYYHVETFNGIVGNTIERQCYDCTFAAMFSDNVIRSNSYSLEFGTNFRGNVIESFISDLFIIKVNVTGCTFKSGITDLRIEADDFVSLNSSIIDSSTEESTISLDTDYSDKIIYRNNNTLYLKYIAQAFTES